MSRHTRCIAVVGAEAVLAGQLVSRGAQPVVRRRAARARLRDPHQDQPVRLASQIHELLREHRLGRRVACLALPDSLLTTVLGELPQVEPRLLDALVARRVREELGAQSEVLLADHLLLDEHDDDEPSAAERTPTRRAFVAWGEQRIVLQLLDELERRGILVDRVVPLPLALLERFAATRDDDPTRLEVLLHLSDRSAVIGVSAGQRLLYARFLADVLGDELTRPCDAAVDEVRHTARFVREHHSGRAPEVIWLAGLCAADEAHCAARIGSELQLAARPYDRPDADADAAAAAAADDDDDSASRPDDVALDSVAWHLWRHPRKGLDLAPARWPLGRRLLAMAVLLIACTGLAAGVFLLDADERRARAASDLSRIEARLEHLRDELPVVRQSHAELARHAAWDGLVQAAGLERGNPVDPLFEAVARLPAGLGLEAAELTDPLGPDARRQLRLALRGDLTGDGAGVLRDYVRDLQAAPWCAGLSTRAGDLELPSEPGAPALEEIAVELSLR